MKCPNCGKEIAEDSNFCEYCGVKINFVSENSISFDQEEYPEIQKEVASLELLYGEGGKLTWQQREQLAKNTKDSKVLKKLQYDKSKKVLEAILSNPVSTNTIRKNVKNRLEETSVLKSTTANSETSGGCLKSFFVFIIIVIIIVFVFMAH